MPLNLFVSCNVKFHISLLLLCLFQGKPPSMATGGSCKFDSQRHKLEKLAQNWNARKPKAPDPSLALTIWSGPGTTRSLTLLTLKTEYAFREEVQRMLLGLVLYLPVKEFRLVNLPKPDRQGDVKFKEGPTKDITKYSILMDLEDIKKQDIRAYNEYMDKESEVFTKDRVINLLESLGLPALVIRSVKLSSRGIRDLQKLGLLTNTMVKEWEADLMVAVAGEKLQIRLLEVKRKNELGGDQARQAMSINQKSTKTAINKAFNQLGTDCEILQVKLCFLIILNTCFSLL